MLQDSEEHRAFRDSVRQWARRSLMQTLAEFNMDQPLSGEDWGNLRSALGGHGMIDECPTTADGDIDWIAFGILLEEVSAVEPSLGFYLPPLLLTPMMYQRLMNDEQLTRFKPLIQSQLSSALSEPDVGSDGSSIRTVAVRDGGEWVINGSKTWCGGGDYAAALMVSAKARSADGTDEGFALIIVPRSAGYITRPIPMLGVRAHGLYEVYFDDVRVPLENRMALDGDSFGDLKTIWNQGRAIMAVKAVGIAQGAFELALEYAKERQQFGRPIAGFQLVQEMLAKMATSVSAGRLLAYQALSALGDASTDGIIESSMAKAFCTEMCLEVASTAIQVHGAIGLSQECKAEKFFRDARMMTIPEGTTQIQHLIVGRELTGISAIR